MALIEQVGTISILRFAPSALVVHGVPTSGGFAPSTASEALGQDASLAAVLDGPMFEKCGEGSYATYRCGEPRFLVKDDDTYEASDEPGVGGTIWVEEGVAKFMRGAVLVPNATVAVQGYPTLVEDGRNVAGTSGNLADHVWRAALVIGRDGQLWFAVGHDTMHGFATSLINAGALHALYTDGGGSARLATRDGFVGSSEDRRVPLWLGVREGVAGGTLGKAALVVVGAAALAGVGYGAWTLARRSKTR